MLNNIVKIRINESWQSKRVEWRLSSYYGSDNDYFINEKNSTSFKNIIKHILDSKHTVDKEDTIYASKASEIPRFKLKEFIKEKNLKKTSRFGYANTIIVNKGYIQELNKKLTIQKHTFIKGDLVDKDWKSWAAEGGHNHSVLNNLYKNNKDKNTFAIVDDYSVKNINNTLKNHPKELTKYNEGTFEKNGILFNLYRENKMSDLINLIYERQADILSGKCKIIFDEELFVELNKEGIELDEEYLTILRDMLFSEDKSNVKLGFEMMSNLVVTQPMLLSVSFLLNELIHTTNFRPSYYTSSNSNLKSLLKVLKTKGIYWEREWKTFGTGLRLNFKEGNEGAIVKKFLLDNINREFKLNNSAAESLVDIVFATEAN